MTILIAYKSLLHYLKFFFFIVTVTLQGNVLQSLILIEMYDKMMMISRSLSALSTRRLKQRFLFYYCYDLVLFVLLSLSTLQRLHSFVCFILMGVFLFSWPGCCWKNNHLVQTKAW